MAHVLAVANPKGGVGKTTTTLNLAAALAERGLGVLALDLDPQASLTVSLGSDPTQLDKSIADALGPAGEPLASIVRRAPERFDWVPANHSLNNLAEPHTDLARRVRMLHGALGPLRERYDYILVDCPANAGLLTGCALVAADSVLIPLAAEHLALQSLDWFLSVIRTIRQVANPNLAIAGVVITMFDSGTRHAHKIVGIARTRYASTVPFFDTLVPRTVIVRDAAVSAQSALLYAPHSSAAGAYRELAREIAAGGCAPHIENFDGVLARADEARSAGDMPAAYACYDRATELGPGSLRAWLGRGATAGDWTEQIRAFVRAQELDPESRLAQVALKECVAAHIAESPSLALAELLAAADLLHASGRNVLAARVYRAGTELDWNSEAAWLGLARTADECGDVLTACDRVLAINPHNSAALDERRTAEARVRAEAVRLVEMGVDQARQGCKAGAHRLYAQATELDPTNDRAWLGRARTAGDLQATFEWTQRALEANPNNAQALELYHCLYTPEPEPRGRWFGVALAVALVVLVAMALLFLPANPIIAHWVPGS